jgi:hypothetical protein
LQAGFDQVANAGDGDHKVFSKEISGKKVVDKLYHKVMFLKLFIMSISLKRPLDVALT